MKFVREERQKDIRAEINNLTDMDPLEAETLMLLDEIKVLRFALNTAVYELYCGDPKRPHTDHYIQDAIDKLEEA